MVLTHYFFELFAKIRIPSSLPDICTIAQGLFTDGLNNLIPLLSKKRLPCGNLFNLSAVKSLSPQSAIQRIYTPFLQPLHHI